MAREYLVSITRGATTVWLTSDGTGSGRRCKTNIPAADQLFEDVSGNTTVASGGSPFTENPDANGGGREFDIEIPGCPTARLTELQNLHDAAGPAGEFEITIVGEPGSVTVSAIGNYKPTPIGFGRFTTGNMKNVIARYITTPV